MTISPVSNVGLLQGSQQAQNQKPPKPNGSQTPTDTVQLSPAALAHLKGADADGDGDGH
ncbi:MAG TPA: hypothetical protein VKT49_03675 [Bryobacteraceae bacterium]|nr:hypothetical protein [Bryobacteraceae bacterium]